VAYSEPTTFQDVADRCAALARRLLDAMGKRGYALSDARGAALSNCARVFVGTLVSLNLLAKGEGNEAAGRDLELLAQEIAASPQHVAEIVDKTSRLSLVVLYQFQVEHLFKALLRELRVNPAGRGYYGVANALVTAVGLPTSDFDILYVPAHLRNSLHAGGVHEGHNGTSSSIPVDGFTFHFLHGQPVTCAGWGHVLHALAAATDRVERVLDSPAVSALGHVSA